MATCRAHAQKTTTSGDPPRHGTPRAQKMFENWELGRRDAGWGTRVGTTGVFAYGEQVKTTNRGSLPVGSVGLRGHVQGRAHDNRRQAGTNHSMEHHAHIKKS